MRGGTHASTYIYQPLTTPTHTHMLGAHASFHLIPMFSWSSSGETLISVHTRIVYPLDVPLTGVARHSSLLFCVCLGHRVMSNHVGSQVGALSYPVSPRRGDYLLIRVRNLPSRLERMHARGDTCKHLYIPTSHHTHTHMLGAHASFHLIPMVSWSSSGETLISVHTRIVYPHRRSSDRGSPA